MKTEHQKEEKKQYSIFHPMAVLIGGLVMTIIFAIVTITTVFFLMRDIKKNPEAATSGQIQISNNL